MQKILRVKVVSLDSLFFGMKISQYNEIQVALDSFIIMFEYSHRDRDRDSGGRRRRTADGQARRFTGRHFDGKLPTHS